MKLDREVYACDWLTFLLFFPLSATKRKEKFWIFIAISGVFFVSDLNGLSSPVDKYCTSSIAFIARTRDGLLSALIVNSLHYFSHAEFY